MRMAEDKAMKVLVVDDNQQNRYLLEQELKARRFAVVCAHNGAEALQMLQKSPADLIISDVLMPEMDGFQLCYSLKHDAHFKQIPFIFYTATYTDAEDEALGLNLGAEAYLLKPADPETLMREIEAVLQRGKKQGYKTASVLSSEDEITFLKQYTTRVVRKLEKKIQELEDAKAELAQHAQSLEQQVAERTTALRATVAELEAFSYSVSHDLRAPLRAIQGYAAVVKENLQNQMDKQTDEFLDRIMRSATRLDALVQDMLAYSRMSRSPVQLKPIDLDKVVRDIINHYPELHPPRALTQIDSPLPPVIAHEGFLTQCLSNLLSNAVKFIAPGVQPQVRVRAELRSDGPKPNVRVWVEDNGIGIQPSDQERIFKIFERGHHSSEFEGTGIGLAIVQKAAERMGGTAGVESQPGKGSRFWIQLPAAST